MVDISEKLKMLRKERGLTIQAAADGAGIALRTYQNYEYGQREISTEALKNLADFYGVTTDYLLGRDTTPPPDSIQAVVDEKNLEALEEALFRQYMELPETARKKVIEFMYRAADEAAAKKNREQSGSSLTTPFATNFDGGRIPIRDAARNGEEIGSITLADKAQLDSLPDLPDDL